MVSLNNMDTILGTPQTGYVWSMLFEFDVVLDNNDNPHLLGNIYMLDLSRLLEAAQ